MKQAELRKFANEDVVGQKLDGLLFEGKVEEKDGGALVVKVEEGPRDIIDPGKIKWLAVASRYC